ncbi:hypothetical protein YERSI8AC_300060 [Enterobacterales bacterium 8AC]|nr:hypothetical protein YERSI8AC_300060 [Enterobacterales bacterium 8AC]
MLLSFAQIKLSATERQFINGAELWRANSFHYAARRWQENDIAILNNRVTHGLEGNLPIFCGKGVLCVRLYHSVG